MDPLGAPAAYEASKVAEAAADERFPKLPKVNRRETLTGIFIGASA